MDSATPRGMSSLSSATPASIHPSAPCGSVVSCTVLLDISIVVRDARSYIVGDGVRTSNTTATRPTTAAAAAAPARHGRCRLMSLQPSRELVSVTRNRWYSPVSMLAPLAKVNSTLHSRALSVATPTSLVGSAELNKLRFAVAWSRGAADRTQLAPYGPAAATISRRRKTVAMRTDSVKSSPCFAR